jgi:uncharacterized protein (TIGR00369 family)
MRITENPFLAELGFELVKMEEGQAEITFSLRPEHTNSWKVMHGGVIMTLLDACMSRAARSLVSDVTSAATVEMKTSFFQPGGKAGSIIKGVGRVLHRSTTMYYCEGEIYNGDALVAKAMGTFKVFRRADIARRLKV